MSNDDETLVREVDEQLRTEQQLALLKRYGPLAAGAFLAFLLGLGGWLQFQNMRTDAAQKQAEKFFALQDKAGENGAVTAADLEPLTKQGPQVYRELAMMQRAATLEAAGDLDAALAQFDAAAEAAKDPVLRDSARIRAAYIVAETQDFDALRVRLNPMIQEGGRISYLARELLGVEAWEAGDEALARDTFQNLSLAFDAPESVRQRTNLALAVIGEAPAEAPSEGQAPASNGDAE